MITLYFFLFKVILLPHALVYKTSSNKEDIDLDLERWAHAKNINKSKIGLLLHFLAYSKDFRTLFYFRNKGIISHILNLYCKKDKTFTIDIRTKIKGGVLTGHPYCTILNAESIGSNFFVNQLVTVGEIEGKRPKIGDNVSIYTNATIIGGITIGNNVKIGAGAVVVKDVPDNSTVVGNPFRIINKKK